MTDKHTPGPWKFRELECEDGRGMGYVSGGPNDVDLFHTGAMELWASENRANARLIAAAPDLYVACKIAATARLFRPSGTFDADAEQTMIDAALAAIAKAEQGESNDTSD